MACHLFPIATRRGAGQRSSTRISVRAFPCESSQIVTGPVRDARNPAPTRHRHKFLQISGAVPDGLARGVHRHSRAPADVAAANGNGPDEGTGLCIFGEQPGRLRKELAPGGHQEQGESRVTEFRAPDLKSSGAEGGECIAKRPLWRRVSAAADERYLKVQVPLPHRTEECRNELRRDDQ